MKDPHVKIMHGYIKSIFQQVSLSLSLTLSLSLFSVSVFWTVEGNVVWFEIFRVKLQAYHGVNDFGPGFIPLNYIWGFHLSIFSDMYAEIHEYLHLLDGFCMVITQLMINDHRLLLYIAMAGNWQSAGATSRWVWHLFLFL